MTDFKFLTVAETAELLRVKHETVYAWIHRNPAFPRLKVGRRVVIPRNQLSEWLNRQQAPQLVQPVVTL
jgi:excisionase family DNA binding protein